MEPAIEQLDIHSTSEAFVDYSERFEIWDMTKEDHEDVTIAAHFLTFIGKEAYILLKTLALPNQLTYQISHVIVPNMAFPNDSHISDEIS
ncbi:unnamed protein product [Schistosoma curassoni]|uniref:PITH domain-containing protein n=1 Tax=Schistosoma curassoni TaxID=6186 RepID=A0A183K5A8_9TREM|nr:unnamed protein product [Schistosoma curassoni]